MCVSVNVLCERVGVSVWVFESVGVSANVGVSVHMTHSNVGVSV